MCRQIPKDSRIMCLVVLNSNFYFFVLVILMHFIRRSQSGQFNGIANVKLTVPIFENYVTSDFHSTKCSDE